MIDSMNQRTIKANGIQLNVWSGGKGKPVLFIHGFPQSAIIWRKVAPNLLDKFTIICPDLRGYGDSEKPVTGYDKRTMALDMKLLMEELGYKKFSIVGHDRGGRVAHRLALDHPDSVEKVSVLDIVPTHTVFSTTKKDLAAAYWHWFFFQIPDLPELFLNSEPEAFIRHFITSLSFSAGSIEEQAMQEYVRTFKIPGTIRAMLEDYRAAPTIDFEHDEEDLGQNIQCPLQALWGEYGKMHNIYDVLATWKEKGTSVTGRALKSGHFIPEEAPDELIEELNKFL